MKIIIVGGGLSGLALSYFLHQQGISSTILEGSSRVGGRIQTISGKLGTPLELGATWFSDIHPHLLALLEELDLKKFPQYAKGISLFQTKSFEPTQQFFVPESDQPSYRIVDGTQRLIDALRQKLLPESIQTNCKIIGVKERGKEIQLETAAGKTYSADKVILSLPPALISSSIHFDPKLPAQLQELLPTVQTWMAGSIKFVLEYAQPYWRQRNYSGMLYSHAGIVTEMYDHTNEAENKYGFTGFLNGGAANYPQAVRKEYVLKQLTELFGEEIQTPIHYQDKVWTEEWIRTEAQTIMRPHQNNGHDLLQESYWNKKLYFSGTETAVRYSGYMEGAILAAKRNLEKIMEEIEGTEEKD